jgi:hypothetical protein
MRWSTGALAGGLPGSGHFVAKVRTAQDRGYLENAIGDLKARWHFEKNIPTHLRGKYEVKDEIIAMYSRNKQFSKANKQKLGY